MQRSALEDGRRRQYRKAVSLGLLVLTLLVAVSARVTADELELWFFWGQGCPYCEQERIYLQDLKNRYPDLTIHTFEVWYNPAHRSLMQRMAAERGQSVQAVPVTIIGDQVLVGFGPQVVTSIELAVQKRAAAQTRPVDTVVTLPLFGDIDLASHGLLLSTLIIAFVDGMNPCSLWMLSILLALVIRTRSRKRILVVGLTFLVVTALVYGGFIGGLFTAFTFFEFHFWIRLIVALIAIGAALIHIKDYFAFGQGISLTIADRHKPRIYKRMRAVLHSEHTLTTVLLTIVLAAGVAVVELPCTAGFPIIWTNLLTYEGVGALTFVVLLLIYLLVYIIDELILFLAALITLQATRMTERFGRLMKLIGGVLMLYLGVALLWRPDVMNTVSGALGLFFASGVTVVLVMFGEWLWRQAAVRG